jgi:ankyrin repeat protein
LHTAAEEGNADDLESLLERGADANVRNECHKTPLNLAVAKGNVLFVHLLFERAPRWIHASGVGPTAYYITILDALKSGVC